MKLIYIHQYFETPDQFGGLRTYQNALHLMKQGHKVTVISGARSYHSSSMGKWFDNDLFHKETIDGIEVIWVDPLFQYHRSFLHRILSFLAFMVLSTWIGLHLPSDLIYVTSPPLTVIVPGFLISRLKKARLVFEVRDIWPESAITSGVLRNPILIKLTQWLEGFAYRSAICIVSVSEGIRDALQARGIASQKLRVVHHGADLEYLHPAEGDSAFRQQYHLQGKFVAIYAGSFGIANHLETVVKAADLLRRNDNIRIVLLGDGKEKEYLFQLAKEYQVTNLIFAAPVPKKEIAFAIGAADVGLMVLKNVPTFKTVLPNKLLDYLACGIPVIINFEGYANQIVEKARAGVLVAPDSPEAIADTILRLAKEPELCRTMGESGRKYVVEQYSREHTVREFEKVLLEIFQRG
jgi:glycosyltransferase involved in cell wall biosynthesis